MTVAMDTRGALAAREWIERAKPEHPSLIDAVPYWREAHRLHPENWTYKRQAWSIADPSQGPTDEYEGDWLKDVKAIGGGQNYYPRFQP